MRRTTGPRSSFNNTTLTKGDVAGSAVSRLLNYKERDICGCTHVDHFEETRFGTIEEEA